MIESWCVVCVDLHAAFGLFPDEREATKVAAMMTQNDGQGCIYMPVRFAAMEKQPQDDEPDKKARNRGYL